MLILALVLALLFFKILVLDVPIGIRSLFCHRRVVFSGQNTVERDIFDRKCRVFFLFYLFCSVDK